MLKCTRFCCPYCGEKQETLLDLGERDSDYFEDCQICCRPIRFILSFFYDDTFDLQILREDD